YARSRSSRILTHTLASNRSFLLLSARWKPEIPILQNHCCQRDQQDSQGDEHPFSLHCCIWRIRRRGLQGERTGALQMVLGRGFVVKHRHGSVLGIVVGERSVSMP